MKKISKQMETKAKSVSNDHSGSAVWLLNIGQDHDDISSLQEKVAAVGV